MSRITATAQYVCSQGVVILALLLLALTAEAEQKPRIAIIIDDLGYVLALGQRAIELPGPVACAVLPATPRGRQFAAAANAAGKEVLLHLPLEAMEDQDSPEPGVISLDMSRGQFARTFAEDMQSVPYAIGVNSHRGSLLTRHPGHMSWLMEEIKAHGNLFFVDSYTTDASVAMRFARESGIPALKRDVFLDPDESPETVVREFERLKNLARKRGFAVAIGHPYAATMDLLERELPRLAEEGIELVSISELLAAEINGRRGEVTSHNTTGESNGLVR